MIFSDLHGITKVVENLSKREMRILNGLIEDGRTTFKNKCPIVHERFLLLSLQPVDAITCTTGYQVQLSHQTNKS